MTSSDLRFNIDKVLTEQGVVSDEKSKPLCVKALKERLDFLTSWIILSSFKYFSPKDLFSINAFFLIKKFHTKLCDDHGFNH